MSKPWAGSPGSGPAAPGRGLSCISEQAPGDANAVVPGPHFEKHPGQRLAHGRPGSFVLTGAAVRQEGGGEGREQGLRPVWGSGTLVSLGSIVPLALS